jgi:cytochrome P450
MFCRCGHLETDLYHRLPLGVPHRVAKDDWYEGMLIPKDATVVIPAYAIHRSEQHNYTDPNEFNPKRYLGHPRLASDYAGSPDFNNRDKSPSFITTHPT